MSTLNCQSCEINNQSDCHVAILLQLKGLRYFIDVANAKPYTQAVHLGDRSTIEALNGTFQWGLRFNQESGLMELHHSNEKAISFHPANTVPYSSFYTMIKRSRSEVSFGPFLTGLKLCLYPNNVSRILAVRDACIFDGSSFQRVQRAAVLSRPSFVFRSMVCTKRPSSFASHSGGFAGLCLNPFPADLCGSGEP